MPLKETDLPSASALGQQQTLSWAIVSLSSRFFLTFGKFQIHLSTCSPCSVWQLTPESCISPSQCLATCTYHSYTDRLRHKNLTQVSVIMHPSLRHQSQT
mmetsp:Transcript_17980/g.31953  ORF Transcript_17980/g.31953 Transcript_17980/m.31953 type:complete len:100 (+) Transcript_17980:1088-1387(+)